MALSPEDQVREQEILSKIVPVLAAILQPGRIWLFGSRAKGKAYRGSDFDFAMESPRPPIGVRLQLEEAIDKWAGLHHVDVIYLPEVDEEFQKLVRQTGKVIFDGRTNPGARKAA